MARPELVSVTFDKSYRMYNAGEVAGFKEGDARVLVQSGIAHPSIEGAVDVRPAVERVSVVDLVAVAGEDDNIDEKVFGELVKANIATAQDILTSQINELVDLPRIGIATAKRLHAAAQAAIETAGEQE